MWVENSLLDVDPKRTLARVETSTEVRPETQKRGVIACSTLKQRHRASLQPDLVRRRLVERKGHFMSPVLLAIRLADYETSSIEEIAVFIGA